MPTFAAVDIGSNSCRLKIASVQMHRLKTLYEDREVTRLGESVFQTGSISPEAMAGTIRALRRFHKAVQAHVADKVRVVATSAMRDARNAEAFREWVRSATGWEVEVISGLEEGRLIHLGVVTHEVGARGKCLMIDLGGGSCEVTASDGGTIKSMVSMPLGAVRLQEEFLRTDPPAKEDVARLKQFIERELKRAERKMGPVRVGLVIATSGTASALAGGGAGDWAAAVGDYCGRGAGVCESAGADGAEGISLLGAGAAGRDAGADAGGGGPADVGASEDGERAVVGRAGGVQALRDRAAEDGAGAGTCGAVVRRTDAGA